MSKERLSAVEEGKLNELIHYLFGLAEVAEEVEGFELAGILVPLGLLERGRFIRELNTWTPVFCFKNRIEKKAVAIAVESCRSREGHKEVKFSLTPDVRLVRNKVVIDNVGLCDGFSLGESTVLIQRQVSADYLLSFSYLSAGDMSCEDQVRQIQRFLAGDFGKIKRFVDKQFEKSEDTEWRARL